MICYSSVSTDNSIHDPRIHFCLKEKSPRMVVNDIPFMNALAGFSSPDPAVKHRGDA